MYPPNSRLIFMHNKTVLDTVSLSYENVGYAASRQEAFFEIMQKKYDSEDISLNEGIHKEINPTEIQTILQFPSKFKKSE